MSRSWLLGHNGPVLLSIVAQAFLLYISYVLVRILPLSMMQIRVVSGRYILTRTRLRTGTHPKRREVEEGIPL
jgi:hypothetical protein